MQGESLKQELVGLACTAVNERLVKHKNEDELQLPKRQGKGMHAGIKRPAVLGR